MMETLLGTATPSQRHSCITYLKRASVSSWRFGGERLGWCEVDRPIPISARVVVAQDVWLGLRRLIPVRAAPRNLQHYEQQGTISANGKTLLVNDHWNVTTTPPTSPDEELGIFTQRGATFHILAPGSGIVLLDAGYLVTLFPSGDVVVAHGQFPLEVSGDVSSVCAALTP
jgi:hypothetical protein